MSFDAACGAGGLGAASHRQLAEVGPAMQRLRHALAVVGCVVCVTLVAIGVPTPPGDLASTRYCLANPAKQDAESLACLPEGGSVSAVAARPRLLVLTDIGGDPDDQQSMVRLMTFANEFDIEGLIASASGTPGELKQKVAQPHLIREIVDAYGKVRDNLARHSPGYPTAASLLDHIKSGNPDRGLDAIGDGHDSEGSRWIIAVADRSDPRPLNIVIWGGQTDLGQALWRVRHDRDANRLRQFVARLRVYDISDQDRIAEWILKEFPDLWYILAKAPQGRDHREAVFRGMYLGGDESLTSRAWIDANIRQGHGPLGALYPPKTWTAPNPNSALKEGDTPSWLYFLPSGLSDPEHPEWGGWGGRFRRERGSFYRDAHDTVGTVADARATVWRWRAAFQADFQARMNWCVTPTFADANHHPLTVLNGVPGKQIVAIAAKSGDTVTLSAEGSRDPDGNAVAPTWFVYPEAGTFAGQITLSANDALTTRFVAPAVSVPRTIHIVLQLKDNGQPALSLFRRAIVTVEPSP